MNGYLSCTELDNEFAVYFPFCGKLFFYSDLKVNKYYNILQPFSPCTFLFSLTFLICILNRTSRRLTRALQTRLLSGAQRNSGNSKVTLSAEIQSMTLRKDLCSHACGSDSGKTREKSDHCRT